MENKVRGRKLPHMYYGQEDALELLRLADNSAIDSADPFLSADYKADEGVKPGPTRGVIGKLRKKGKPNASK